MVVRRNCPLIWGRRFVTLPAEVLGSKVMRSGSKVMWSRSKVMRIWCIQMNTKGKFILLSTVLPLYLVLCLFGSPAAKPNTLLQVRATIFINNSSFPHRWSPGDNRTKHIRYQYSTNKAIIEPKLIGRKWKCIQLILQIIKRKYFLH